MFVKSDKKVMVQLLSNNYPYDPILITLIPTYRLGTDWAVETEEGLASTVALMSEREGSRSVKVCVGGKCHSPKWRNFKNMKRWVWCNEDVGTKNSRVTVKGDAQMAVYVYGGKLRRSYGTVGICTEGKHTKLHISRFLYTHTHSATVHPDVYATIYVDIIIYGHMYWDTYTLHLQGLLIWSWSTFAAIRASTLQRRLSTRF